MTRTKEQELALAMLKEFEAGASRVDIGAAHGVGESSVYFQLKFARFTLWRDAHPDDRADIGAWHLFDKAWARTIKTATEEARWVQLVAALPLATDLPPAKAARKAPTARKSKIAPVEASWPMATEAAEIIADKASSPLLRALDEPAPAPEPEAPIAAPAKDPIAAKREAKTIAQRIRRAAAKASVQWRGGTNPVPLSSNTTPFPDAPPASVVP